MDQMSIPRIAEILEILESFGKFLMNAAATIIRIAVNHTQMDMLSKQSRDSTVHTIKQRQLITFLIGTTDKNCAISLLRGHHYLLRRIWSLVCEEWWEAHIEHYKTGSKVVELPYPWSLPGLTTPVSLHEVQQDYVSEYHRYPRSRQLNGGCPLAVVAKGMTFPMPTVVPLGTFKDQCSEELYVNMMPIDMNKKESLPACCVGYWSLVEKCRAMSTDCRFPFHETDLIAYLTIDERNVAPGESQRRGGLHVESPGNLPYIAGTFRWNEDRLSLSMNRSQQCMQKATSGRREVSINCSVAGGMFVPGAEHHWGRGMMMRDERVDGGIFMASNVANTTAVWNCRVRDDQGDIIGPHGDLERCRNVLGPATRTLEAGELIWMTDKTPHESLPLPAGVTRRQYFRLVVGEVSAWFADHSTPNPLGVKPGPDVRIIRGNKFDLYRSMSYRWSCGDDAEALQAAKAETELRGFLSEYGVGHLSERVVLMGVKSISQLVEFFTRRGQAALLLQGFEDQFYDVPAFYDCVSRASELLGAASTSSTGTGTLDVADG